MASSIMMMFASSFAAVISWFERILAATGMTGAFMAAIFIFLLFKFILSPIFGSAGSDKVTKQNKGGKKDG